MSLSSPSERGSALIGVLLLLMMVSALTAAFTASGQTETLVVRNYQTGAQARAAAEAGLNHAAQMTIEWLAAWPNTYASPSQAVNALLDNPGLTGFDFGTAIDLTGAGDGTEYDVELMDEDDPDRGAAYTTLEDDTDGSNDEDDNDPDEDQNLNLVLRARGRAQNNAAAMLEGILTPVKLPAIIVDGDLSVFGSATVIAGDNGGIHANGNLTLTGANVVTGIDPDTGLPDLDNGTATASGTYSAGVASVPTGAHGGGYTEKTLPKVRASFYRSWADYILESTGQLTCRKSGGCSFTTYSGPGGLIATTVSYANGATICDASSNPHNQCRDQFGWIYNDADPSWNLQPGGTPTHPDGTYYVEGLAEIGGSPGSVADPINITVIAEGSIDISGAPNVTPDSTELLFVTDGDLEITGNFNMPLAEGQMLVHEQLRINASACVILGQIVVGDAVDNESLVSANSVQGVTIKYTGDVGNTLFSVTGWSEVR